jgi:mono/diheme cytochrome c family protein
MKRVATFLLYTVLTIGSVAGLALGYAYAYTSWKIGKTYSVTPPRVTVAVGDPATIERGRYLVHKVSMCGECHGDDLGGKAMIDSPIMARLYATNLTSGRGGLAASYSDEDFVRALTHGVRKDGHSVMFMPSQDYRFSAADIAGVVAYLRSLPPVDRETPPPSIGPLVRVLTVFAGLPLLPAELIDHSAVSLQQDADLSTPEKAGQSLIAAGGCRGCHGPQLTGDGGMAGAANLTPAGLTGWSESDFKRALREGRRPNGTNLVPDMPRAFGAMSDEDLSKIFSYLKSLPPVGAKSKRQTG